MADTLITGTTLVEKESRSVGDTPIGGIIEFDDTYTNVPENFALCDGTTITDPLSSYNGSTAPDFNTCYWSCPALNFESGQQDDNTTRNINRIEAEADGIFFYAPIFLPKGATVTSAIVKGNAGATAETWELERTAQDGATSVTMATANIGTADTTITSAIIDNQTYSYAFTTSSIDTGNEIWGGTIIYTPRMKFIIRIK